MKRPGFAGASSWLGRRMWAAVSGLVAFTIFPALNGCHSRLLRGGDVVVHEDAQTLHHLHGVLMSQSQDADGQERLVVCLLEPLQYLGPYPVDHSPVPAWLPFWTDVYPAQFHIKNRDQIEFDVKTDWDTTRPAVITRIRAVPRGGAAAQSCS